MTDEELNAIDMASDEEITKEAVVKLLFPTRKQISCSCANGCTTQTCGCVRAGMLQLKSIVYSYLNCQCGVLMCREVVYLCLPPWQSNS